MIKKISKSYGYNLWLASQHRQKSFNRLLSDKNITHAQYMILHYVYRAHKKDALSWLSQNQLAYNLSLDPMMVSNVLKALQAKWYIDRKSAGIGMANILLITTPGKRLIRSLEKDITMFEKKLFRYVDKSVKKMLQSVVIQSLEI